MKLNDLEGKFILSRINLDKSGDKFHLTEQSCYFKLAGVIDF